MGGSDLTVDRSERLALEEEFPRWLAACDEQFAAGAQVVSPVSLGAPAELAERLDREAAWCQMVRRMWIPAASSPREETACLADAGEPDSEASTQVFGRFMVRQRAGPGGVRSRLSGIRPTPAPRGGAQGASG